MKYVLAILSIILVATLYFVLGKISQSEKHYSVDKQYSWYTKKNAYSIFEQFIPFNDGCKSGTIYIFDEIEKEVLCSYDLRCIHM